MSEYLIETRGLGKRFGHKHALSNFDLRIERGGVHALIGSNGAGKSTLFRLLLGFQTPSFGVSFVLGENSLELSPECRRRVGYVNDEHTLPRWLPVKELKAIQKGYYPKWNEDIYQGVIQNFDVKPDQSVGSLSRGERAGLNLAMSLAQGPELLILDEPTLGLDVVAKQEFLESVMFCTQTDTTVIYCSHQMEEIERLADNLVILERGQLKQQTTPENFSARIQLWVVPAAFSTLVKEKVPNILSMRVIEDELHFFVLDAGESFGSRLGLLGIREAVAGKLGLATAVRAFLSSNHAGTHSRELS